MTRSNKKRSPLKSPPKSPSPIGSSCQKSFSNETSPSKCQKIMIKRAIASAGRHGINLAAGRPVPASGNCAFESVIFNVNDRSCFGGKLLFSPDYYRRIWMTDMKNRTQDDGTWNIYSDVEWEDGWNSMMESGIYERGIFGDLMLFGIACGSRKVLLIFNTSLDSPHDPVYICDPRKFGVEPETDIPVVLAYDLSHYESLHTVEDNDILSTVNLVKEYLNGNYAFGKRDLLNLLHIDDDVAEAPLMGNAVDRNKSSGLQAEQDSLPEHLRGKRPRDMNKEEKKEYNNHRAKLSRRKASADQKKEDATRARERMDQNRAAKSAEEKKAEAQRRAAVSAEEKKEQAARMARMRAAKSADKKKEDAAADRVRKSRKQTKVVHKEALKSKEIMEGSYVVNDLRDSDDSIGKMDIVCQDCGAWKFRKETASTCCGKGKVLLDPFPQPPEELHNLWHDNTSEARLFRENARSINNALCLTSIKVKVRHFEHGFNPSVIFEGKATQLVGPLMATDGEQPCFAQLYVHDPTLECGVRFKNMTIPANMSKAKKNVLERVLTKVQNLLHSHNPFVHDFKQIIEIPVEELGQGKLVISAKARPKGEHERRYNPQMNLQEVSILTNNEPHDLVLQQRGGSLQAISDLNPKGMPLHFTLLFPYGTYGWDLEKKHADGKRRVTTREFYVFHLNQRDICTDYIHLAGRLFQEWICMAWVAVENQKLMFQCMNQKALRADTYKNIREATAIMQHELAPREDGMFIDDNKPAAVGRKILSSSFSGSPRWYNAKFQDGMAIVREYHQPDFFITMTCNPNWPEIQEHLKQGQTAQDRPDIVARVFKQKKDQLMQDIKSGNIFGNVVAHMHVIEFQKRGLPHAHILIILADDDRTLTAEMVDNVVVAELPPDPEDTDDPLIAAERKRLQDIVLSNMIHGPCGAANPSCPCMENGRCTKNYPKEFQKQTTVDPDNNYATYRRRAPEDGGRQIVCPKTNQIIDNRNVVPYNPFLSLRMNCHINVERCTSPKAAKYLYKYVTKGSDRAMVATVVENQAEQPRDEISEYEDLRSVGSSEATWHLMAFPIADRYPPVQALRLHIEDQQQVVFDEGTEEEALENQRETELTAFFKLNEKLRSEGIMDILLMPRYLDMPKKFRYDKAKKQWFNRKACSEDKVIGRIHTVNPVAGEVFYLRILLHNDHCRGKTSFQDLKVTPNGKICETYKEVCRELGLLRDDIEWQQVLEESAGTKLCPQIRELFIVILMFCQPANPRALLDEFWHTWTDDFEHKGRQLLIPMDSSQLKTMLMLDLELRLQSFEKELTDFGLPKPSPEDLCRVEFLTNRDPVLVREEKDYNLAELVDTVEKVVPMFTPEQLEIFETVLEAVQNKKSLWAFIDARGGCGKTFLLNAILSSVRSMEPDGCVALAMATTGIAANLLTLGRTFHSRLKAPLTATAESTLQISAQSSLAKLVRMAKLFLIDESTMLDRFQLEALDRSLRDLMGDDQPFGGKIILLAGDFRQCLPVVPGSNRAGTVSHCINNSKLWQHFCVMRLSENMRVRASGDPALEAFDKWTLSIGNGLNLNGGVPIPEAMITEIKSNTKTEPKNEENSMKKFCQEVFPDIEANINTPGWLEGRTILAPTNKEVNVLNEVIQGWLPQEGIKLQSADTLENSEDAFRFNTEYLNTLRPNGFPQHVLNLKPGMPLMLLRNINPRQGLCNGTRLIFDKCIDNKLLQCRIVETNRIVLIPRISFIPKPSEYPFEWQRRQFPVRPAFAITINKSQGQTLKFAGVWLRGEVFTHGQLYVACSRVSHPDNLRFALMRESNRSQFIAVNIVYKEVLLNQN